MDNTNKKTYNFIIVILSVFIPIFLLLIVFLLKGIYPFGDRNISYFDMSQLYVPSYYHAYDFWHGDRNFFWSWYNGTGVSTMDIAGSFIFSPFNIIFFFVERNSILDVMSILLLIKVGAASASMTFYTLSRYRRCPSYYIVLTGVLYGCSGFVLQYYSNIFFLDMVVLFPLIVLYMDKILQGKKSIGFCITTSLGLINNVYFMIMVYFFLLLYSVTILAKMEKNERKKIVYRLGISVINGMLISAVFFLPTILTFISSPRASSSDNLKMQMLMNSFIDIYRNSKMFMLYGCECAVALVLLFITIRRKKASFHYVLLVVLFIIPIFCENVNRMWHIGGYVQFPMRFGYMLTFVMLLLGNEILYLDQSDHFIANEKIGEISSLLAVPFTVFSLFAVYTVMVLFCENGIRDQSNFAPFWLCFLILSMNYFIIFLSNNKRLQVVTFSIAVIGQCFLGWYGFLAPNSEVMPECTDDIVINSEILKPYAYVEGQTDRIVNRIKDNSVSLNANYPQILQRASMSNWSYGTKQDYLDFVHNLGYGENYNRTLDCGGTVFSDAMFHVTDIISFGELDSLLYLNRQQINDFVLGETNFCYPFGLLINEPDVDLEDSISALDNQNRLFSSIGNKENLISIVNVAFTENDLDYSSDGFTYSYTYSFSKPTALYLDLPNENYYQIFVDGKQLKVPDIAKKDNLIFPGFFNNGLQCLGTYCEGEVNITILSLNPLTDNSVNLGLLDLEMLQDSINSQMQYERTVEASESSMFISITNNIGAPYLLLPLAYSDDYNITVNEERIEPLSFGKGALLMIPVDEGENHIQINVMPKGIILGALLSIFGIVILLFEVKLDWITKTARNSTLCNITLALYYCIVLIFLSVVYIFPIITTAYYKLVY